MTARTRTTGPWQQSTAPGRPAQCRDRPASGRDGVLPGRRPRRRIVASTRSASG